MRRSEELSIGLAGENYSGDPFGEGWKCRLTGGFHGELEGGSWRAGHGGAVGELW